MQSCSSELEKVVGEIEGLSKFRPGRLSPWLRTLLRGDAPNYASDEELVASELEPYVVGPGAWLQTWGEATINGQSVFLFETDYLTDPICWAADWQIGFTLLEPSDRYENTYFVGYFFERGRRPVSDDVTEPSADLESSSTMASCE
jgi:hypothetical protein